MHSNNICLREHLAADRTENAVSRACNRRSLSLTSLRLLLRHWHQNWRTRRQLAQLDSHQLKDIGVSIGDAQQEADKPFWRD
ncbi:DUF1127 domain-containing protein [Motiliproteus coralliicola]|uniref:DUF1127 domain-containing protein n=1 Tax=Motiliproteus coralliicola TaxID=2283196 RepID=A0A369WDW8_9GAMM|nr:DUF1127 domain-containing protein [Motiliproteus coralliicola]RDE19493.1 DUF1127 domain-containing protein [Motiliproteus coralliicola]